jgi:MYXO-CTERM domain-containing protein
MKRLTNATLVAACVVLAACDQPPEYRTAERQVGLELAEIGGEILDPESPSDRVDVVVGSQVCIEQMTGWFSADGEEFHVRGDEDDDAWLRECFDLSAGPGASFDGDSCITVDAAGETAFELSAKDCELTQNEGPEFADDRLLVASHAIDDLVLAYEDPILRAIHGGLDPGPVGAFPPAPQRPVGEPLRVLADGMYTVFPQPTLAVDPARTVGFTSGVPRAVGEAAPEAFTANADGTALIDLAVDQVVAIELALPAGSLVGDDIVGVDPATAAALEVTVGYQKCAECSDGYGAPVYAIAIVRDADGGRLFGANVEWTLDDSVGELASAGAEGVTSIEAACTDAEGESRSGTLNASYGALAASTSLEFVCPDPGELDGWDVETVDDSQDSDLDLFGCGCNTEGRGPGTAGLLAVLVGLAVRRRRR